MQERALAAFLLVVASYVLAPGVDPRALAAEFIHNPQDARAALPATEQKAASVTSPDPHALAEALGVELAGGDEHDDFSRNQLLELHGVSEGKTSDCLLFLSDQPSEATSEAGRPTWRLSLLSWDGEHWRAWPLRSGTEPLRVKVIVGGSAEGGMLAVIIYAGYGRVPFPAIYEIKNHSAALVWDSQSEESRYEGYRRGRIEFLPSVSAAIPPMVVSGRADPGLLIFGREGTRGFEGRTTYEWKGNEYVPVKTEYEANEDFRLYEFIAALHLRNFKAAYALTDPAKFLHTDQPSLGAFREAIEKSWGEFLDDRIFTASEPAAAGGNVHAFELGEDDKKVKYFPEFSSGPKYLLTGLARREE